MLEIDELSSFFHFAADVMCVLNADGLCCQVNPAFEQLLGDGAEDLRDRPFTSLAHPEDGAAIQSALDLLTAHDQSTVKFTSRHRIRSEEPSNPWRWLEWHVSRASDHTQASAQASNRYLYCIARDVSDRTAQAALSDSSLAKAEAEMLLYAHTVHNMQLGLNIWRLENADDASSLRLVVANPAAKEIIGIPESEDIVGQTIQTVFPAIAQTNLPQIYANVALSGQGQDVGEVAYEDSRIKKGIFTVKAFALPGQCVGVAFENITEKKAATLTLRQQKNDLIRVNMMLTATMKRLEERNQELDQFAYVTSHDLKAPLRAISNLASWIEEDIGDHLLETTREQIELLKSRVRRMEGLIDGLLEYSRIGRTRQSYEQVDVAKLLNDIADSVLPNDGFVVEVAPNMPVIKTTRVPLAQLFSNLITNAIKHHDRPAGTVQVSVRELEEFYEFSVADDGPGIDPKYHEKIFTIFQTLKSRDELESTGIGLSLVKKIVMTEGGEVTVESQLGEGATFRFTWPKEPRLNPSLE